MIEQHYKVVDIPRNTKFIKYKKDYGETGKCSVKWCRHPNSWWLCWNCGAATCKGHQVFNYGYGGGIPKVIKCYYCEGNKQYQKLMRNKLYCEGLAK